MKLFRDLTEKETAEFKAWARANYTPFSTVNGTWHPVVQAECAAINAEVWKDVPLRDVLEGGGLGANYMLSPAQKAEKARRQ